jgi:hypothetical protein
MADRISAAVEAGSALQGSAIGREGFAEQDGVCAVDERSATQIDVAYCGAAGAVPAGAAAAAGLPVRRVCRRSWRP